MPSLLPSRAYTTVYAGRKYTKLEPLTAKVLKYLRKNCSLSKKDNKWSDLMEFFIDEGFATRIGLSGKWWWWSGWIHCIIWKQYTTTLQFATVAGDRSNPFFSLACLNSLQMFIQMVLLLDIGILVLGTRIHIANYGHGRKRELNPVFLHISSEGVLCFLLRWSVNYGITWMKGKIPFEMGAWMWKKLPFM